MIAPTASLSLVGRGIRAILHELGPVLEAFEELKVHLLTQAASDLNLTFLVDEDQSRAARPPAPRPPVRRTRRRGRCSAPPGASCSRRTAEEAPAGRPRWWRARRRELLELAGRAVAGLRLRRRRPCAPAAAVAHALGRRGPGLLFGQGELPPRRAAGPPRRRARASSASRPRSWITCSPSSPELDRSRLLFTPNFAPREEYRRGFEAGARVTLDNVHPLREWPEVFRGREVFLRLDPGRGARASRPRAHRRDAVQVRPGPEQVDELLPHARRLRRPRRGPPRPRRQRHPSAGAWSDIALFLAGAAERFPDVRVLDLGGGLGVPEQPEPVPARPRGPGRVAAALQGGQSRASSSGWSPAASWWPRPACCWPG